MFVVGSTYDGVIQYDLSTAWDVSTASHNTSNVYYDSLTTPTALSGIRFNDDGTVMFVLRYAGDDRIYQYNLSTAYDITSVSNPNEYLDVAAQDDTPFGFCFNNDGTQLFMTGVTSGNVHQYSLSTAYDVTTGSYVSSFDPDASDYAFDLLFNPEGNEMYLSMSGGLNTIYQYTLSSEYDITTASYANVSYYHGYTGIGMSLKPDGTKLYLISYGDDTIYQYSTGL